MPRAESTARAYAGDWVHFRAWCADAGLRAMPASGETVARYVDGQVGSARMATVRRRLAAIRARHVDRGRSSPTATQAVRAAVARAEWRQRDDDTPATPLGVGELRAVSRATPPSVAGRRDRALVLVGYGGGLRPGELASLGLADVRPARAGLALRVARGEVIVPPGSDQDLCAIRAWDAWRTLLPDVTGPAFRAVDRHGDIGAAPLSTRGVTRIVQRSVQRAGLDPTGYSGRSLRRGMVLAATEQGVSERRIMAHTGHRSRRLVRRYMRESRPSGAPDG